MNATPRAMPGTGPSSTTEIEPNVPPLNDVLWALHDHLGRMEALYKELRAGHRGKRLLVDIRRSANTVTSLALSLAGGGSALPVGTLILIDNLIYTSSVSATLSVGDNRTIAVATGVPAPGFKGVVLYPQDTITLIAGSPANMYLELTGECLLPDDRVSIIR